MAVSTTATRREQLINVILNELDDEQLEMASNYIKLLQLEAAHLAKYDPNRDPFLTHGDVFQGLGNLSERAEEILYGENDSTETDKNQ